MGYTYRKIAEMRGGYRHRCETKYKYKKFFKIGVTFWAKNVLI